MGRSILKVWMERLQKSGSEGVGNLIFRTLVVQETGEIIIMRLENG